MSSPGLEKTGKTETEPWKPAQPYFKGFLGQISDYFGIPGSGVVADGLDKPGDNLGVHGSPVGGSAGFADKFAYRPDAATTGALDWMQRLAQGGSPINPGQMYGNYSKELVGLQGPTAASKYLTDTASGGMLGSNPYFEEQLQRTMDDAANRAMSMYSSLGRGGSDWSRADLAKTLGGISNDARAANYEAERGRQMQAVGMLDSANLAQSGQRLGVMNSQAQMSPMLNDLRYADADRLARVGAAREAIDLQRLTQPADFLARYAQMLGAGSPGGTVTQYEQKPSPWLQALGGISSLAGLFGSLMSDERVKTDIERVGQTDGGTPIYTYHYKGMENGPTLMGVLAQEAAETSPGAVMKLPGGMLAVNYSRVK